ncbi:MAG: SOS response-associated peptidase [Caldilinea sp. CFX5]|nr:SOS response-associated peptidase [Caldilinea sp. CFX5]
MCGRFTLTAPPDQLATLFELPQEPVVVPRYNIAPTQPVAVVRMNPQSAAREWALTYWGLVPSWSKDPSMGARMINARAETVTEKPAFRAAFKRRRCLVPANGFYEWQKQGKGKQPFYITTPDGAPFAIAGLWEYWEGADGSALESCTLLTTSANTLMTPLHDRMPVIIAPEDYAQWLGTGRDETPQAMDQLQHLLRPYADDGLMAYPVSTYVNNTRNEGADCVQALIDHG